MPIFDVDIHGTKYQIDAPDENQAATQALRLSQQRPPVGLDVDRQKAIALAQATALAEQQQRKALPMTPEQQRAEAEADAARRAAGQPQLITMPDGQVVSFPAGMPDVQIRGLIASKYPKEVAAATLAKPASERDVSGHYEFNGSNIPGYDPATGIVSGGAVDDNVAKQYGVEIRRTAEATAGLPGDVGPMFGGLGGALANQLGVGPEEQGNIGNIISKLTSAAFNPIGAVLPYDNAISTDQIRQQVTNPLFGDPGQPLTDEGQAARTFGEFAGGAFAPGGVARKVLMMLAPAAASETAGQSTKGTPYEPYARTAAALLAGGVSAAAKGPGRGPIAKAAGELGARTKDLTRIIKSAQRDGLTPEQIQTRLAELGPDATLMDVGPNLRQEGQRIYAQGGRGRGIIDETLTARDAGANQRIRGEIDQNLGPAFPPSQIDKGLKRTQRSLGPEYDRVLADGKAVDTEAIANDIQSAIANTRGDARAALEKVRDMLRVEGSSVLDPHPRAALATRQAIDGMLEFVTDGNVRHQLGVVRKSLDKELTRAVPGIKAVDAKYANLAEQRKAVERGQTILDSGRGAPWPADLAADIAEGGRVGKLRLAQGARADIERIVGTNANDRVALQRIIKGEGDWNRQKLAQLFGQGKADRMIAVLEREGTFADTSNRVMKNSATAERLPEGGSGFGMKEAVMSGGPKAAVYSGIIKTVDAALDKMRGAAAASRDERVARILSDTNAQKISTALLKANGGKPIPQNQIEGAVRTLLLTSGATAGNR